MVVEFKLGPSRDPGVILFASPTVDDTARMLSFDRDVWIKMGRPTSLRVTIEVLEK